MLSAMTCTHPGEERKAVYAGGAVPLRDRTFCSLCGEVVIVEAVVIEEDERRPIPGQGLRRPA